MCFRIMTEVYLGVFNILSYLHVCVCVCVRATDRKLETVMAPKQKFDT